MAMALETKVGWSALLGSVAFVLLADAVIPGGVIRGTLAFFNLMTACNCSGGF